MKENIERIKNKITSSPCKYIIVFCIIFVCVFVFSYSMIVDLEHRVNEKHINYTDFTVADKFISSDDHYYLIVGDDNQTYEIFDDDQGIEMFNQLKVGDHYHFIIEKDDGRGYIHIIKVYNESKH